jgi:hypothetical protein
VLLMSVRRGAVERGVATRLGVLDPDQPAESVGDVHGRAGEWKGYVIGIVDKAGHVSGGCRAESADGTRRRCYLGRESIRQDILGPSALGQYLPETLK